jgi:hypothetical protein
MASISCGSCPAMKYPLSNRYQDQMSGALSPAVDQLLPLVRKMEAARHAEDVGYLSEDSEAWDLAEKMNDAIPHSDP